MRKIVSAHAKKKKDRITQLIVAGVLIFIMFFSVLAYAFRGEESDEETKIEYNGFEFVNQNEFWFLNLENLNFVFKYNPNEVGRIDSQLKYINNYYGKPLYISSESNEAEIEIYRNLNQIAQRIQPACLNTENCDENWPMKNCTHNFIIIKKDNISEIEQEDNCVFISAQQENLTRVTDEFLFKILSIT